MKGTMNVLVILGHPRIDSYCAALADAFIMGARASGTPVEYLRLSDLKFETNVLTSAPQKQYLEEDLRRAQELILWADHLVFVFPTWWGQVPAILKGFLDRTLTPGFAFRELQADAFDRMLFPRTAQIITTMDTPRLIDRLINGSPIHRSVVNATLKFCGVSPVRALYLSPVKHVSNARRGKWLRQVYHRGLRLRDGVLTPWDKFCRSFLPWLKAIRLQFYPMTFFAYAVGGFAAAQITGVLNAWVFWLGYLLLFLFEVIVVFNNEYHDQKADRLNRHFSAFSGGSRVLVSGLISEASIKNAMRILTIISAILAIVLSILSPNDWTVILGLTMTVFLVAISYTAPPVKFSYRGLGELIVGVTHSFAVILCGFVFQGGGVTSELPWRLGLPLFLSIIPAIIMAGMPDYSSDKQAGKRTLVVRLGKKKASLIALLFLFTAPLAADWTDSLGYTTAIYEGYLWYIWLHALLLGGMIGHFASRVKKPKRIDGIMVMSLLYIMWFAILPFLRNGYLG